MLLFGYGLSLDVENIPLAIVDYDQSVTSRDYAHRFTDSRYFSFQVMPDMRKRWKNSSSIIPCGR
jgi:hypothetical protein